MSEATATLHSHDDHGKRLDRPVLMVSRGDQDVMLTPLEALAIGRDLVALAGDALMEMPPLEQARMLLQAWITDHPNAELVERTERFLQETVL